MSARRWAAVVAVAAVGVGGAVVVRADGPPPEAAAQPVPTTLGRVERRDLAEVEEVPGRLGYADSRRVAARLAGTLTGLPAEGATVGRGQPLYEVDGVGVPLLVGARPAWRDLGPGVGDGPDVAQLEANLAALGHDVVVDGEWTAATTEAVRDWQQARGLARTGRLPLGSFAFLPGPVRVAGHEAEVGSALGPGAPVLSVSSARQVVTVDLDARRRDLAGVGRAVTVELPGGRRVAGRVESVGAVAAAKTEGAPPSVDVVVALSGRADAADQAPVTVRFTGAERKGALAVPVTALLALAEGGYAVEVEENGARRLVGVTPGLFVDGWVEVAGVAEGAPVVMPR